MTGTPQRRATKGAIRPAGASSKLVCTVGPLEGQSFELSVDEVVIGRSADATIAVTGDTSMSRKHALVRKTEDGWAISDLGSGNGTLLNGAEVAEEMALSPDDVIVMGDSEFRFSLGGRASAKPAAPPVDAEVADKTVDTETERSEEPEADDPEPEPEPEPEPVRPRRAASRDVPARRPPVRTARNAPDAPARARPARRQSAPAPKASSLRRVLIRFLGFLAIALALAVGWKAIQDKNRAKQVGLEQAMAQDRAELDAAFQEAKRLTREGKWVDAKAKLEELQAADPDYEPKSVQQYLERAGVEIPNQAILAAARELLAAGRLGPAAAEIAKIAPTLGPTETARTAFIEQLEQKVRAKALEGRAMLSNSGDLQKMEALRTLAEDLIAARPDDREALELKRQAELAMARIRSPVAVAAATPETPWLEVQSRFRTGDESGAVSLAEACAAKYAQCRTLDAQIKEFDSKLKTLDQLPELELYNLFELDRKIAGGQSSDLSKPIRTRVAAQFYMKASQAKTTGNWSKAIENARRVLQADPAHAGAVNLLAEARNQARDVYLRGYQLKDNSPEEAARLFKEVIGMTPKDDEYHQKADARLAELQKQ